ncbi:MAG: hypothetical protein J5I65_14265 [Aridibacter famidurans]|nr:hypothetical protein [Aridibacter famidurans]
MIKIFVALFVLTVLVPAVVAQSAQNPCESESSKEFDFWLGTWDLEWKSAEGAVQKGTNEITKILGGCVVRESFDGGKDMPLKGQSYSMFDSVSGKWKQTWVDNQGSYLDFTGGMEEGKMVLSRSFTNRAGKPMMQRMVFFNISKDVLEWNWESSADGGKTWTLAWHIKYLRRK